MQGLTFCDAFKTHAGLAPLSNEGVFSWDGDGITTSIYCTCNPLPPDWVMAVVTTRGWKVIRYIGVWRLPFVPLRGCFHMGGEF